MSELITSEALSALFQVIMIDLALAGDNAVVIGLAAAGLQADQRKKAILVGIIASTILRFLLASLATQFLEIVGLLLAGGILLLWVCWKMWRELQTSGKGDTHAAEVVTFPDAGSDTHAAGASARKTLGQAAGQIIVADVSMSLDNVLAVAGAAREHFSVLIVGLGLSIAMMGLAASFIAHLLQRYPWIAYLGLAVIVYVAVEMIYHGALEVWPTGLNG
jgi:YjbE family integral membrane protein